MSENGMLFLSQKQPQLFLSAAEEQELQVVGLVKKKIQLVGSRYVASAHTTCCSRAGGHTDPPQTGSEADNTDVARVYY